MFAQVKKPKMNIDVKIGGKKGSMKTGKMSIAGLKNQVEDLAKPAKIDTNVSINKKKGVRVKL